MLNVGDRHMEFRFQPTGFNVNRPSLLAVRRRARFKDQTIIILEIFKNINILIYSVNRDEVEIVVKEIDAAELQARIAKGDDLVLLDIRSTGELVQGMLPDADHLPMHLIPVRIDELPTDKDVVLYCHSGARSFHACAYLAQQGYENVINLQGGILGWARSGYQLAVRKAS